MVWHAVLVNRYAGVRREEDGGSWGAAHLSVCDSADAHISVCVTVLMRTSQCV